MISGIMNNIINANNKSLNKNTQQQNKIYINNPNMGFIKKKQMFFNSNSIINRIQNIKPGCSSCGK